MLYWSYLNIDPLWISYSLPIWIDQEELGKEGHKDYIVLMNVHPCDINYLVLEIGYIGL